MSALEHFICDELSISRILEYIFVSMHGNVYERSTEHHLYERNCILDAR